MVSLDNLSINITVSDPWEFGCGPFSAMILRKGKDIDSPDYYPLLIRFDIPVEYKGEECRFFVAKSHNSKESIEGLLMGETLTCNLIMISKERAEQQDPFDISWWRGGCALLADIKKC